ncbi:MAG: glycosyl hydrolase [Candidatus Sumerlaeota bacterium]
MKTANPEASSKARNLLKLLNDISGQYILSGQHDYISSGTKYADTLEERIGFRPALWGSDFSFEYEGDEPRRIRHCGPLNLSEPGVDEAFTDRTVDEERRKLVERAVAMHERGHVITLMWHHPFPTYGNRGPYHSIWSFDERPDMETWRELTTPGTTLYDQWRRQADDVARYLRELRDADIPVLWRPYHEMNGVWFWWCKKPGDDGFRKLWKQLFDYFTNEHELNNLLWVWNPNAPRDIPGDEAFAYADYYPGNDCVDVLASDV